jgi:DeoR family fructose operon transcriptional repressor
MSASLRLQRLQDLLALIERDGSARASDIARSLGVSRETVRRDLAALEESGFIVREHGGAAVRRLALTEQPTTARAKQHAEEKGAIAERALALITDGQAVAVDSSTTALALARLVRGRDITLITNGLLAAYALAGEEATRAIVTGGIIHHGNMSLIGPEAEAFAGRMFPDIAFLSAPALGERGVMDTNPFEVAVKQALLSGAERVCVLADHTKFGRTAFEVVTDWSHVDTLITDRPLEGPLASQLAESEVELLVAPVAGPRGKGDTY